MQMRTRNFGPPIRLAATLLLVTATGSAARGEDLDSVMYSDPAVSLPRTVKTYPKGLAELWLTALDRPEREFKCRAALAIASAHESGMAGLDKAVGPLIKVLEQHDQHPAVQVSAIRALVALDARGSAPIFLRLAQSGDPELRDIVEAALARWDYRPARDFWIERLDQPPPYGRALLTAIRGLMTVREERAAPGSGNWPLRPTSPRRFVSPRRGRSARSAPPGCRPTLPGWQVTATREE